MEASSEPESEPEEGEGLPGFTTATTLLAFVVGTVTVIRREYMENDE